MSGDDVDVPPTGGFRESQRKTIQLYREAAERGDVAEVNRLEAMVRTWFGNWNGLVEEVRGILAEQRGERAMVHVSVERVRTLRFEVPALARTIEISSVEDHKGRGWGTPLARIWGPGDCADTRIAAHELPELMAGLTAAFAAFDAEFGLL